MKALEQNMSMNAGVVDELMTRHREQMVEVQRAFNQTHETFSEIKNTTMMMDEQMRRRISSLEYQLALNNEQVSLLLAEKELFHWQLILCHVILVLVQLALIVIAANVYIRRISRIAMAVTAIDEARRSEERRSEERRSEERRSEERRSEEENERKKQKKEVTHLNETDLDEEGHDEEKDEEKSIQYQFINQSGDVSTTSSSMFDTQSFEGVDSMDHNNIEGSSCDWSSGQIIIDSDRKKLKSGRRI